MLYYDTSPVLGKYMRLSAVWQNDDLSYTWVWSARTAGVATHWLLLDVGQHQALLLYLNVIKNLLGQHCV